MSAVSDAVGGATDFLVGGKQKDSYNHGDAIGSTEQNRNTDIENQLKALYSQQGQVGQNAANNAPKYTAQDVALQNQARQQYQNFLGADHSNVPNAAQMQQANQFVDQTFTNPAQNALNDYQAKYEANGAANAAALGRNPNADMATNQANYAEGMRNQRDLQAERGSRVAQQALGFNQDAYNRGLNNLNVGNSGVQLGNNILGGNIQQSSFLNGLQQQALSNQIALLNGRTGFSQMSQNERMSNRTAGGGGTSSGLLTNINAIGGGLNSVSNTWSGTSQLNNVLQPVMGMMQASGSMMGGASGGGGGGLGMLAMA